MTTPLHAETYGEPVAVVTLIHHMLEAFKARDRGFRRGQLVSHHNPSVGWHKKCLYLGSLKLS